MKILIILLVAILQVSLLVGQSLTITVRNDDSQPMPYAHIHINGVPSIATGKDGTALLDAAKLKEGDIVSASFVGTVSDSVEVDAKLIARGSYGFILREDTSIEEVIVVPDAAGLFFRLTKILPPVNYDCIMDARFDYSFYRSDRDKTYRASGMLSARNYKRSSRNIDWHSSYYTGGVTASYSTDTTVVRTSYMMETRYMTVFGDSLPDAALHYNLRINLSIFNRALHTITTRERKDLSYFYLGKRMDCHMFRISYPEMAYNPFAYQLLVSVDAATGDIRHIEMSAISCTPYSGNMHMDAVHIDADMQETSVRSGKKPVLTSKNMSSKVDYRNGSTVEIRLSGENIRPVEGNEK